MRSVPVTAPRRRSRRRGVLTALLVALLVAVPIVEVWLLIQVGQALGALPTISILMAEAALGAWLMRREGSRAYAALTGAFATGRMPTLELAGAALVLVGGVLLMLPGFAPTWSDSAACCPSRDQWLVDCSAMRWVGASSG